MTTIEILMQTIDALTEHATYLEARLAAYENKSEVSTPKSSEASEISVQKTTAPLKAPTFENLLIQGRSKVTKNLSVCLQSDLNTLDTLIKSTRYIASTIKDINGLNIADANVLTTKDNKVAVCTLHENNILMIDFTTGQTLHKLPITTELDPTALQNTINEEGWSIFTTTYESPSYALEDSNAED